MSPSSTYRHKVLPLSFPLESAIFLIIISADSRLQSLVSHSHHNKTNITRQIEEVRVDVATDMSQTFTLNLAGTEIHGSPVRGQVSLSNTADSLSLLMTEECAAAQCPPYELVNLLADVCGIKDPNHYSLLNTTLSSSSLEEISSTFTQQGISVRGLVFGTPRTSYLVYKLTCRHRQVER